MLPLTVSNILRSNNHVLSHTTLILRGVSHSNKRIWVFLLSF